MESRAGGSRPYFTGSGISCLRDGDHRFCNAGHLYGNYAGREAEIIWASAVRSDGCYVDDWEITNESGEWEASDRPKVKLIVLADEGV